MVAAMSITDKNDKTPRPDRYMVSSSTDHTVRIFDVENRIPILEFDEVPESTSRMFVLWLTVPLLVRIPLFDYHKRLLHHHHCCRERLGKHVEKSCCYWRVIRLRYLTMFFKDHQ